MQFCIGFFSKSSKHFQASAFDQGYSKFSRSLELIRAGGGGWDRVGRYPGMYSTKFSTRFSTAVVLKKKVIYC
jgi:hypothetical protein